MALTDIDRDLLTRCLNDTASAWPDFVNRFLGLFVEVVNQAYRLRGRVPTAEETDEHCSEILFAILKDNLAVLREFRSESSLATFLCVVARRIVEHRLVADGRSSTSPTGKLSGQRKSRN